MNKYIAITGGIGSGKSTVRKIIKELGYNVLGADETYNELLIDEKIVIQISNIVGIKPLTINGKAVLDRKRTGEIVFSNKELLKKLTDFTNEKVLSLMFENAEKINSSFVFFEVPLLFENKFEDRFDSVIIINRCLNNRIESLKLRNNFTQEEIIKRIDSQFNYDLLNEKDNYFYITNDEDIDALIVEVNKVLGEIIEKKTDN